jgi:hypothetical protein
MVKKPVMLTARKKRVKSTNSDLCDKGIVWRMKNEASEQQKTSGL